MSDYIKREDAIRQIVKTSAQNELDIPAIGTVIYILSEMDSADVRENANGKWIQDKHEMAGYGYFDCSVCGADFYEIDGFNFCPNCGADMRREDNGRDEENHNRV